MKDLEERADDEVSLIEQDETMTDEEKRQVIRDIYQELHELRERIEQ